MSLRDYIPYIGRVVVVGNKKWKVRSIHADHPDHPWGWMVRLDNRMDQCRLSLNSESFAEDTT